jgi:quinolinate synthase
MKANELSAEAERLFRQLMSVDCSPGQSWDYADCESLAALTLEIAGLKRDRGAIVLAHSYVGAEIIYGVADFAGDSYDLSLRARDSGAEVIVFAGVRFMAETVKVLAPAATVLVPDAMSGCSLADSIDAAELRRLKAAYPEAAVVCYINSSAEVKAESDVCVTSSSVHRIIDQLPQRQILFVPDRIMGENLRRELRNRGSDKELITSDGTCIVHDAFEAADIARARAQFPGIRVVTHPESPPEVASVADYVGSTGGMMDYVRRTDAPYFLVLTECGLVGRLQSEARDKRLVGGCRLCPYMKLNSLEKIRDVLRSPKPEQVITIDPQVRRRALVSVERMFEMNSRQCIPASTS